MIFDAAYKQKNWHPGGMSTQHLLVLFTGMGKGTGFLMAITAIACRSRNAFGDR